MIEPVVDISYLKNGAGVDPSNYGVDVGAMTRRHVRVLRHTERQRGALADTGETPSPVPDLNSEHDPSLESCKFARDVRLNLS